jgi:hypothetical protein
MSSSFTPGPWEAGQYGNSFIVTAKERMYDVAVVRNIGNEDNEANARLIAAAPELLEALRGLLPVTFTGNPTRAEEVAHWTREHELGNGGAAAVLAAYAAIAKATGARE